MKKVYPKYLYQSSRRYNFKDEKKLNNDYIFISTIFLISMVVIGLLIKVVL